MPQGWSAAVSKQRFEQQFQLAQLDLAVERIVGTVDDGDGKRAVVAEALKLVDDPGIVDLALADAGLKLAGLLWTTDSILERPLIPVQLHMASRGFPATSDNHRAWSSRSSFDGDCSRPRTELGGSS